MRKAFGVEIYQKAKISDLILVSLYNLENSDPEVEPRKSVTTLRGRQVHYGARRKITFEDLLKECFNLFSEKFSFPKYPNWPDSRKLDRPLRTLRKEKLIFDNLKENLSLTKKGKKRAQEIINLLRQKKLKLK